MAFMMPVMKNNYEIYPAKPRRSNSGGSSRRSSRPHSRNVSESEKAANLENTLLSPSPPGHIYSSSAPSAGAMAAAAAAGRPQRTVRFCRSASQDRATSAAAVAARRRSNISRASTSSSQSTDSTASCCSDSNVDAIAEPASPKFGSLTRFHCKLVDSLKRKLRIKDEADDDAAVIRAST